MPTSILFATHTYKEVCRTSLPYCENCALPLFFPFITEACPPILMSRDFLIANLLYTAVKQLWTKHKSTNIHCKYSAILPLPFLSEWQILILQLNTGTQNLKGSPRLSLPNPSDWLAVSKLNLLHLCKYQLYPFLPLPSLLPAVILKRCYISSQHPFYYTKQAKLSWPLVRNVLFSPIVPELSPRKMCCSVPWGPELYKVFQKRCNYSLTGHMPSTLRNFLCPSSITSDMPFNSKYFCY